jgi:predicted nucleic acid-binding protein
LNRDYDKRTGRPLVNGRDSIEELSDDELEAELTIASAEPRHRLLEVELSEAAFAIALKQRWGRHWRGHRTDGRARRPACQLLSEVADRSDLLLSSVDRITIPVGRVATEAAALMTGSGLASYDAVHAATAISAGAGAIVTLDTGFALLPARQPPIFTDSSRVASCRAKRPRR